MEESTDLATDPGKTARSYSLNDFEGPLDLLLFLIKKNEVSIYDIPIASITEQFLASIAGAERIDLDDMTEFYALAATLLYIKSRMLLPVELDLSEELDDPRQDLVDKLIEYQKYKKLSELMERKELEVEWTIERTKMQRALPFGDEELWDKIDVWDLLKSFSGLMGGMSSERIIDMYEEVSINEKMALIHEFLDSRQSFIFVDLITRPGSTLDIVCAFLAILEAVKYRVISIHQHRLFGDIQIRRFEERKADGPES
ncbi:MAG: segregation/condensation protein A [Spirochaetae bacterium HGW-Spirochaetae-7]|jgi:segregation and condensation protein A|nr:MAG: segregation/condensation protein A [Spirochaetae bacterium HGW-Spirochaetae-7]